MPGRSGIRGGTAGSVFVLDGRLQHINIKSASSALLHVAQPKIKIVYYPKAYNFHKFHVNSSVTFGMAVNVSAQGTCRYKES